MDRIRGNHQEHDGYDAGGGVRTSSLLHCGASNRRGIHRIFVLLLCLAVIVNIAIPQGALAVYGSSTQSAIGEEGSDQTAPPSSGGSVNAPPEGTAPSTSDGAAAPSSESAVSDEEVSQEEAPQVTAKPSKNVENSTVNGGGYEQIGWFFADGGGRS